MRVYVESRKIVHIGVEKTEKLGEVVFDLMKDGSFYGRVYNADRTQMVGNRFTLEEFATWLRTKPQGGTIECLVSSENS